MRSATMRPQAIIASPTQARYSREAVSQLPVMTSLGQVAEARGSTGTWASQLGRSRSAVRAALRWSGVNSGIRTPVASAESLRYCAGEGSGGIGLSKVRGRFRMFDVSLDVGPLRN